MCSDYLTVNSASNSSHDEIRTISSMRPHPNIVTFSTAYDGKSSSPLQIGFKVLFAKKWNAWLFDMILGKLWNEIEAVRKYKRRLQGMIRLLLNEMVINSYIISMNKLPRFWRKTHWLDFPFLKFEVLGELEYFNQQSFFYMQHICIYATTAKTGVTLI